MSDPNKPKNRSPAGEEPEGRDGGAADFAARMARSEFGRHYIDPGRIEQTLWDGEIVFRHKPLSRGPRRR
jgi:hypothetical protein